VYYSRVEGGKTEEGWNSRHQAGIEGFQVVRSYAVNERERSLAYSYEITSWS